MRNPLSSVWTREPTKPRPNNGLGREQIVRAAVEILDSEGLDALSMRKLGAKLGAGATSLYWYVANKDELLELALDEFWGTVDCDDPETAPWREIVSALAYRMRRAVLDHPWAASLIGRLPSIGPNALRLSDRVRRALNAAGFHGVDVYLATGTIQSFVLGHVIPELAWRTVADADHDTIADQTLDLAGDYPDMVADYRATARMPATVAREVSFDFAVMCLLDGLAARLYSGAPAVPRTALRDEPRAHDSGPTDRR